MIVKKIFLTIVLSLTYLNLYGQLTQTSQVPIDLARGVSDIYSVDLDSDGKIDIVSSSVFDNKLAWYKNLGNEKFDHQEIIILSTQQIGTFVVEDMDGDGDLDIVAGCNSQLIWVENLGNAVFGSEQVISSAVLDVRDIDIKDIDSDGDFDIISSSYGDDKIAYYENLGSGSFATQIVISSTFDGAQRVVFTDVNNDGEDDILACSKLGQTLTWFENTGTGVFNAGTDLLSSISGINDVKVLDYDGDSDIDIFLSSGGSYGIHLRLLENQGSGTFNTISTISNWGYGELYPADIDDDGDLDLLTSGGSGSVLWYENDGTNNLSVSASHSTGKKASLYSAADINLDGNLDIIGAYGSRIFWSENNGFNDFEISRLVTSNASYFTASYEISPSLRIHDVDQDGMSDVVSCTYEGNNVSWYKNLGAGNFDYIRHITDTINQPWNIIFVEIDNDGLEDLVVGTISKLVWHKNLGGGNFSGENIIKDYNTNFYYIHAKDVDGDGNQDLIVYGNDTVVNNKLSIIKNLGSGNFSNEIIFPSSNTSITSIDFGDLDNDGDIDVAATFNSGNILGVWWWENDGTGGFGNLTEVPSNMSHPYSLKITDFNGDNELDIVAISKSDDKIMWFENLGGGSFTSQIDLSTNVLEPVSLEVADMDGDNDIDIVVGTNHGSTKLVWFKNLGGVFSSEILITNPTYPYSSIIKTADIDLDGDPEIVLLDRNGVINLCSNYSSNTIEISGKLYVDLNLNGVFDSLDYGLNTLSLGSIPQSDYSYSYGNGDYHMSFSDTNGTYSIQPDSIPYWSIVSDSNFYSVTVDTLQTAFNNIDFGFYPDTAITIVEADLYGQQATCNTIVNYWMHIENIGTTIPSGTVCLELDSAITYTNCPISPDSIVGQKIYWNYDSLSFFQSHNFYCEVTLPDWTFTGDTVISIFSVSADTSNSPPGANITYDTLFQIITCAYDPNDKIGFPYGIDSMGYILQNTENIEYTIRFQNTGTDTAQNIIISDDLDPNLDWTSLDLISSSHSVHIFVDLLGTVYFTFNNIQLVDSVANEPASHGYVKFNVEILDSLPVGTSIYNSARIFFDQNPPIITNTEIHTTYNCETIMESIQVSNLFCNYSNLNFEAFFNNNPSTANYHWDLISIGTSDSSNFIISPDTTGTFSLYAAVATDFCSLDTTINIQIGTLDSLLLNTITICEGDSVLIFNNYESTTGYYYNVLQSSQFGCDSILYYYLDVIPESIILLGNLDICSGDSVNLFGNYHNEAGDYYDTLSSIFGCDSVLNYFINVKFHAMDFNDSLEICEGDSVLVFGNYQTDMGVYYDSLNTTFGCDSVSIFNLEVIPYSNGQPISLTICEGDSIDLFGSYRTETGNYHDTLNSVFGCDSILTFHLGITPHSSTLLDSLVICEGDSILLFGNYISNSGYSYDTVSNAFGCDSVLSAYVFVNDTTNVNFNLQFDDSLCLENVNYPLTATIPGGQFNGVGVVGNSFNPELAGEGTHLITYSYVDSNGCYSTNSINIIVQRCLGLKQVIFDNIKIFPNPTSGLVNIVNYNNAAFNIKIISSLGQTVHIRENILSQNYTFEINNVSGVYMVEIEFQSKIFRYKLVKY